MAALAEQHPVEVIDLRRVSATDLDALLLDEIEHWRKQLRWDFAPSAELVRQYVANGSLSGVALIESAIWGRRVIGYGYYVQEDHKALIGDLYIADGAATRDNEYRLLRAMFDELRAAPAVRRIECQLMMLRNSPDAPAIPARFPGARTLRVFARNFMAADAEVLDARESSRLQTGWEIVPWSDVKSEESSRLIADCYADHIDSQINDQYRTAAGARRFLANIVQYPGCGRFFPPASVAVINRRTGVLCGLSLASLVASGVGHITQICVAPSAQGHGLGRELLRRSLRALADDGCGEVSLTVTASNVPAVRLYERIGFRVVRRFSANVWEWS